MRTKKLPLKPHQVNLVHKERKTFSFSFCPEFNGVDREENFRKWKETPSPSNSDYVQLGIMEVDDQYSLSISKNTKNNDTYLHLVLWRVNWEGMHLVWACSYSQEDININELISFADLYKICVKFLELVQNELNKIYERYNVIG